MIFVSGAIIEAAEPNDCPRAAFRVDPDDRAMLHLFMPDRAAVAAGDHVVVADNGHVVGVGTITDVNGDDVSARLDTVELDLPDEGVAVIIPDDLPDRLAPVLPPCVAVESAIDQESIRGSATSQPASASAPPQTHYTAVEHIDEVNDHQRLHWPQPPGSHFAADDRVDLFRRGQYVGFAKVVTEVSQTVIAEPLQSMSAGPAQVGDLVIRRKIDRAPDAMRSGYIFRQERDYCLVSLGELDGIGPGDRLYARSTTGKPRELIVERVYPDHCGADVSPVLEQPAGNLPLWARVRNKPGGRLFFTIPREQWRETGVEWLISVSPGAEERRMLAGDFVQLADRAPGLGVLLFAGPDTLFVYVPGVWSLTGEGADNHERKDDSNAAVDPGLEQSAANAPDEGGGV